MPFDGPLTEEQRRFAEQNHALVYKFLHQHGLSVDEYYDIVIFGFLLAVQRYLTDASLAPYAFSTVAWSAMESALRNHRRTARRKLRLHTGSGRHGRYRLCRRELPSETSGCPKWRPPYCFTRWPQWFQHNRWKFCSCEHKVFYSVDCRPAENDRKTNQRTAGGCAPHPPQTV